MAIGDRITGERTTGFMRRINALENTPEITSTQYAPAADTDRQELMDINYTDGKIWIGNGPSAGNDALVFERTSLAINDVIDDYPASETEFPGNAHILSGDLYAFFDSKKHKYDIGTGVWSELSSADSDFIDFPRASFTHDGSSWFNTTDAAPHDIERYNAAGVNQATITLDEPAIGLGMGDTWGIKGFGFDDDGNILSIVFTSAGGGKIYAVRHDDSGNEITGSFDGGADTIELDVTTFSGSADHDDSIQVDLITGKFVTGRLVYSGLDTPEVTAYSKTGVEVATEIVPDTDLVSMRFFNDEIYAVTKTGTTGWLVIYDDEGTELDRRELFTHTKSTRQTTFHRYPQHDSDTGKVSLGTPDGGVAIPSLTGLDGFRPHNLELNDMRDALESEAILRGVQVETGTTTSTTSGKLVDSGQDFLTTVSAGDTVRNTTDTTNTTVSAVDSDTALSLADNIMVSGEDYIILSTYTTSAGVKNIFRNAIDSGQDDWTTATVSSDDRIREDYYGDIGLVLTELESTEVLV